MNKYKAKKTIINGITFDSKAEANHYVYLLRLKNQGVIRDLKLQVPFNLNVAGVHICKYIADFTYIDTKKNYIVEDVKGVITPVFKLKQKLMKAIHRIDIKIIKTR